MLCFVRLNAQTRARALALAVTAAAVVAAAVAADSSLIKRKRTKKQKKFCSAELAFASVFFFARRLLRLISGAFGGNTRCSRVATARARRQRGA